MGNSSAKPSPDLSADEERQRRNEVLKRQEEAIMAETTESTHFDTNLCDSDTLEDDLNQLKSDLEQRSPSTIDPIDVAAFNVNPADYTYPFQNLVFEGGGNKGLAYIGALQCLEDYGIMQQVRRVAGTSAGAITASLCAVGYNWEELQELFSINLAELFLDHSCGYLSILPNLISKFGWNPGISSYEWFGEKIKAKSRENNPDMTFYDLYRERKIELCILVTNLNLMSCEYCHPKTTPDMPIRDAIRMTMAIPAMYAPVEYDNHGQEDTYVDGGVICNYPINCFDGWYLSMDPKDSFLQRLHPLKDLHILMSSGNRFSPRCGFKTLGFLLYDETEQEVMRYNLDKRIGSQLPVKPDVETKLFKIRAEKRKLKEKAVLEHGRTVEAVEAFMNALAKVNTQVLAKNNDDEIEYITKDELKATLDDESFDKKHKDRLFGNECELDTVFNILDRDGNDKIAFPELVHFIEEHGIRMQTRAQGFGRRKIDSFFSFLNAIQLTLFTNLKYIFVKSGDDERSVGINTGHVETNDYSVEEADREFTRKRGYNATHAYLRYFVAKYPDLVTKKGPDARNQARPRYNDVIIEEPQNNGVLIKS